MRIRSLAKNRLMLEQIRELKNTTPRRIIIQYQNAIKN